MRMQMNADRRAAALVAARAAPRVLPGGAAGRCTGASPLRPEIAVLLLLAWCLPALAGCGEQGTLECHGGACGGGEDGGKPGDGSGGGDRDAGGQEQRDLNAPRPDLPRQPPEAGTEVDLGTLCPGGAWPRLFARGVEPSGGSGGSTGDGELQVTVEGKAVPVLLHVPDCPQPATLRYGLVVVLHDADGNREYLRFKWLRAAAERGYVVALPLATPSYGGSYNWLESQERNRDVVLRTVEAVQALYDIERRELLLAGLGVGATFANQLAAVDEGQPFGGLLLVNGTLWDPVLEARGVKSFVVLGTADAPHLAQHGAGEHFRYLHVPELGPYFPGPAWPLLPGDREVVEIDPTAAVDWFFP